jgi:hypothetical protein
VLTVRSQLENQSVAPGFSSFNRLNELFLGAVEMATGGVIKLSLEDTFFSASFDPFRYQAILLPLGWSGRSGAIAKSGEDVECLEGSAQGLVYNLRKHCGGVRGLGRQTAQCPMRGQFPTKDISLAIRAERGRNSRSIVLFCTDRQGVA